MKLPQLCFVLTLLCLSVGTQASLIGDAVDAGIFDFGNRVTGFGLDGPFTVEAGPSDAKTYSDVFVLDVDATGFTADYLPADFNRSWTNGVEFRIFDLDLGFPIGGLLIDTNIVGWIDAAASFTANSATFAW